MPKGKGKTEQTSRNLQRDTLNTDRKLVRNDTLGPLILKKKLKGANDHHGDSTNQPGTDKPPSSLVRTWLKGASEAELDGLSS